MTEATKSRQLATGDTDLSGTVLIVDDEPEIVDLYAARIAEKHDIRTATSGEECLEQLDDDVDVVLLDRRMPGLSGDRVLERLREQENDCMVAMVTAVRPRTEIIDLEFDAYLVKPVSGEELNDLVEELLLRSTYSASVRELLATTVKLATLRAELPEERLQQDEEYVSLTERHKELVAENDERFAELLERVDTDIVYRDLLGNSTALEN